VSFDNVRLVEEKKETRYTGEMLPHYGQSKLAPRHHPRGS